MRHCVICNRAVGAWLPFHIRASEFILMVGGVGSNVDRFFCPHCRCIDRERHLHLFMQRRGVFETIKGATVLHIAPETVLGEIILRYEPARYIRGDLSPHDERTERIDIEAIPYHDRTFDIAVCNHTLEHVNDPMRALRELRRVLKPGGRLICQTPYASRLTRTFEEPLLQSPEARLYLYAQDDHLRLFGLDIEQIIIDAGFAGRLVPHDEILAGIDPEEVGVNEREPFFDFTRS